MRKHDGRNVVVIEMAIGLSVKQPIGQAPARSNRHRRERCASGDVAQRVDVDDMDVVQRRDRLCLAEEPARETLLVSPSTDLLDVDPDSPERGQRILPRTGERDGRAALRCRVVRVAAGKWPSRPVVPDRGAAIATAARQLALDHRVAATERPASATTDCQDPAA